MIIVAGTLLVIVCLATEAFFSGSEIAMNRANHTLIEARANQGDLGSQRALALLENHERLFATCLIGTNVSTVTAATAVSVILIDFDVSVVWTSAIFLPLVIVFGETLPKTIFEHHADRIAPMVATPLLALQRTVLRPALAVIAIWDRLLHRWTGHSSGTAFTRQDLLDALDNRPGEIDPEDRRMIQRVLEMSEVLLDDCMTPLVDLDAIEDTSTVADATEMAITTGRSRIPVFQERIDNIIGMVHHLDLLLEADDERPVRDLCRKVRFVPASKSSDDLLEDLRQHSDHMVVVVDEYGGSVGIVTVEDLLEELVGDIRDEREAHAPRLRRIGDRKWKVPARTEIETLNLTVKCDLPEGDYETVAGLILTTAGRIPRPGEVIKIEGYTFRIQEANERAVLMVHLTLPPLPPT